MSDEERPESKQEVLEIRTTVARPMARDECDAVSTHGSIQEGVRGIEAISLSWTGKALAIAYIGIMLMAFTTSLEGQVTLPLLVYVTSSFRQHSLVSTVSVVQGVINAVVKPPMAKIADVFGRLEAFTFSVFLFVLGYIQMSASTNVQTFASAQIFYSAGSTGMLILQQIFIADTSDLSNRALFSTLPDIPYLFTTWMGPPIAKSIYESSGDWRWGYAMWTIILPVAFLPLALLLFLNGRRARALNLAPQGSPTLRGGFFTILGNMWRDLDVGGIILLSGGFTLILVPCTIASTVPDGWENGGIVAMVTLGALLLVLFPLWEVSTQLGRQWGVTGTLGSVLANMSPYPLVPLHLLKSRTFSAGSMLAVFYFMAFYLSVQPYYYSYLLVVRNLDIQPASYILNIFYQSSTVASIVISLLIKLTNHYKWFVVAGSCMYLTGMGLMMHFRTQDASLSAIVFTQILVGAGGGFLNVPAQVGVQASAGHQYVGTATAIFLTLTSLGGAIGSAISGALWGRLVPEKLRLYLPEGAKDQVSVIDGSIVEAQAYAVGSPERDAINRAYQETMTTLLTIALVICVPVLICGLLMTDYSLNDMNQGVKGRVIGGEVDMSEQKRGDRRSYAKKVVDSFKGRSS
ncbi:hypothetical protein K4K59_005794 [Colletotrichum sp. SAR11_240]|nr:hypothetical protein K4K59_005794 [Colletotrichum sp. SAR11_240]